MNEIIEKEEVLIEDMIYEIRGVQVMLSSDVAKLYQVETKALNQTIKRNINRFPSDFCFQLKSDELDELSSRSQFVTLNKNNNLRGYNIKYLPYVLTEQGIMMLSGLLKSDIAVKVNIQIIDAFVKMRRCFANTVSNNDILINHENRILKLEKTFAKLNDKKEMNKIFFEGELYDAYSVLLDILNKANKEIIIIDNYAGKELMDLLKKIDKKIVIVSKNINDILKKKYESQYNNTTFINNNSFHDRFIILDRNKLYSCGASFKDLGKKCFSINEFNDETYLIGILKILCL
ncbi:MAG: ORF6N domain-containing protein [Bacilli bacterium]|nr:ORF6N domain-containing protein [Bacilli bacterium]